MDAPTRLLAFASSATIHSHEGRLQWQNQSQLETAF